MVWMPLFSRDFPWHTKGCLQGALQAVQPDLGQKCCLPSRAWSFCPAVLTSCWGWELGLKISPAALACTSCWSHGVCKGLLLCPVRMAAFIHPDWTHYKISNKAYCKVWDAGPLPLFTVLSLHSTWVSICSTEPLTYTIWVHMEKYCLAGAPFKGFNKSLQTLVTLIQASWK